MISVQDPFCPVYDVERTINYEGNSQPMLKQGVKHINQWEMTGRVDSFRGGFAIAIVVLSDDKLCTSEGEDDDHHNHQVERKNRLQIQIYPSAWDKTKEGQPSLWNLPFVIVYFTCSYVASLSIYLIIRSSRLEIIPAVAVVRYHADDYELLGKARVLLQPLTVAESRAAAQEHDIDQHRHYLPDAIHATLHYFFGVVIFIFTRIMALTTSADLSSCYFNNVCSYRSHLFPASSLSMKFYEMNAITSSFVFTVAGITLLIYLVLRRLVWPNRTIFIQAAVPFINDPNHPPRAIECGIPDKSGIDTAFAMMLILKGIISAMYHVCPNLSSYLLDAPCTDMLYILSWIRVCQLRHPTYMSPFWATIIAVVNNFLELFLAMGYYSQKDTIDHLIFHYVKLVLLELAFTLHAFYFYYLGYYQELKDDDDDAQHFEAVTSLTKMFSIFWRRFTWDQLIRPDRSISLFVIILQWFLNTLVIIPPIFFGWPIRDLHSEQVLLLVEFNIIFVIVVHFICKVAEERRFSIKDVVSWICFAVYLAAFTMREYLSELPSTFE
ncbi:uncharacterized protein LOC110857764 [Folsomia candida]|uniref:uncharacterized protein LOC110857764 n=1 Tax=Folsomia candida TaxID=158441 RepID=UPI0016051882|nr:uncharacterized protein LOC110857764 [Folsomia candida]XP_035714227.1 uncharacterized protein LOC110857764 [Folsomia candida]